MAGNGKKPVMRNAQISGKRGHNRPETAIAFDEDGTGSTGGKKSQRCSTSDPISRQTVKRPCSRS